MPVKKQVEAVKARLKEHNPDLDTQHRVRATIEGGVITELSLFSPDVMAIAPVQALMQEARYPAWMEI